MKEIEDIIAFMRKGSEGWEIDNGYTIYHKSGLKIWMCNFPILNTNTYPVAILNPFDLINKFRMRRAAVKIRRELVLKKIQEYKPKD